MDKYFAIIVAGGSGLRVAAEIPKQFLELNGLPVLMHSINAFHHSSYKPRIVVAMNNSFLNDWRSLCNKYAFNVPHTVVPGGAQRFDSVKSALESIPDDAIVAVHDGVRPLINQSLIDLVFKTATEKSNAVPAVKSRDSLRQLSKGGSQSIDRDTILIVQTPQAFESNQLKIAYEQEYQQNFTDDASVVENGGTEINLVEGNHANIKLTYKEDFLIAEAFLNKKGQS